jgi:hypothetical protein
MSGQLGSRTNTVPKAVYQVGFWSAVLTTLWIVTFNLALIIMSQMVAVAACLLLAPSFVVLMASLHHYAHEDKKVWSQVALSFASVYMVVVALNYFLQLTVVRQNPQSYAY